MTPLLDIKNLSVAFKSEYGLIEAVKDVSLTLNEGDFLSIVGESGSGKSVTSLALMGLLPAHTKVNATKLFFNEKNLLNQKNKELRAMLGNEISMIFQEPLTSLNPCFTVGYQIDETLKIHDQGTPKARKARAIELLDDVGIPDARRQLQAYPHQLSGGMCQRVMIAMAIACKPKLLIADEPTTALDVSIQAQILDLLLTLNETQNVSIILITHDLAIVSETANEVLVMEQGRIVEQGHTENVLRHPQHPYTQELLRCCIATHGLEETFNTPEAKHDITTPKS